MKNFFNKFIYIINIIIDAITDYCIGISKDTYTFIKRNWRGILLAILIPVSCICALIIVCMYPQIILFIFLSIIFFLFYSMVFIDTVDCNFRNKYPYLYSTLFVIFSVFIFSMYLFTSYIIWESI